MFCKKEVLIWGHIWKHVSSHVDVTGWYGTVISSKLIHGYGLNLQQSWCFELLTIAQTSVGCWVLFLWFSPVFRNLKGCFIKYQAKIRNIVWKMRQFVLIFSPFLLPQKLCFPVYLLKYFLYWLVLLTNSLLPSDFVFLSSYCRTASFSLNAGAQ